MGDYRGAPLGAVAERLAGQRPELAILFIIDGCRADTLYNALDGGDMPRLKGLMEALGYCRFENCWTVFPSVTIACHASIVTGAYPGLHGIVGNNWFIRKKWAGPGHGWRFYEVTREYVKRSWWHPRSDPGLANGFFTGRSFAIADADMYQQARTLYEAHNASVQPGHQGDRSMSILEMITRGADRREVIDLDDICAVARGFIHRFWDWLKSICTGKQVTYFRNKPIDGRAFDNLVEALVGQGGSRPGVFVVWLPGMDGFSHESGANAQPEYFRRLGDWEERLVGNLDEQFGRLHQELSDRNLLDRALIAVTADHGQYHSSEGRPVSAAAIYRCLRADPQAAQGETLPLNQDDEIDEECTDASVVVSHNGGACHIYVRSENGWGEAPTPGRLRKFLRPLAAHGCADVILVRSATSEYEVWHEGRLQPLASLNNHEYPLAEERVNNLAGTLRAGDIILSARRPCYYEDRDYAGEHGSLHRDDSRVPLVFIARNLGEEVCSATTRVIDIAPTIAESMGFLEELGRPGTPGEKLRSILTALLDVVTSASFRRSVRWIVARMRGLLLAHRVERDREKEARDMRQNFEAKLRVYTEGGQITQREHDELMETYREIPR